MALNTIPNKGLTNQGYPSDRIATPLIINGDMQISQRATSSTGKTSSGYYACDRWHINLTTLGTWTIAQETLTSGNAYNAGFTEAFRMDCTTADASPAASDGLWVRQKFEGQNLRSLKKGTSSAEKLTVTFWVKSNKTGTYTTGFYDHDNTRFVSKNYTISSADTWEKKVINFPADTSGAMDNDNAVSLDLRWYLGAGSNATGGTQATTWESFTAANAIPSNHVNLADSTSNDWAITGVQLEVGEFDSTSIPNFPFESYESNLNKCQRYYFEEGNSANGYVAVALNTSASPFRFYFPITMRTAPSGTVVGTVNTDLKLYHNGQFRTLTNVYFANITANSTKVEVDSSGAFDVARGGHFYFATSTGKFKFDAEL
tara:strand:- start:172 stop:1290 length:1119 start_codon:yes stop_codon:yes gene_type:complete